MSATAGLPRPARDLAQAIDAGVAAAQAGDSAAFDEATTKLRALDHGQAAILLGAILREALERSHPDGLDSDDAEQAIERCVRSVRSWYPQVDEDHLVRALAGALGVADPDEQGMADASALAAHGILLIADLLTAGGESLTPLLDAALAERMRAQTIELP